MDHTTDMGSEFLTPADLVRTFAARTVRDVVVVSGPDAGEYLQGQLSQNVLRLEVGASAMTLLLQPQGKIDAWMRLSRVDEADYWLDVEAGFGALAQERLQRFKLRVDCTVSRRSEEMVAVRGPAAEAGAEALGFTIDDHAVVVDAHWPVAGFDVIGAATVIPSGLDEAGVDDLEALRIALAVPAMGRELDETTIPAAAGIVEESVDFTKGCYVGQELVARIDSRGSNTPTKLRRLRLGRLDGEQVASAGAIISVDGAEVGVITSVAASPGSEAGLIGLAYIKRAVDMPSNAEVIDDQGRSVAVKLVE